MEKREYRELSELAANGDTKAFARLYETLYREMYYTACYSLTDEADAVDTVASTARDGFSAVGKLRSEEAFRAFMMKTLCARIKSKLREYADEGRQPLPSSDGFDVMVEFSRMSDTERIIGSMYIGGKFQPDEITAYTGFSSATIKKTIDRVVTVFELD